MIFAIRMSSKVIYCLFTRWLLLSGVSSVWRCCRSNSSAGITWCWIYSIIPCDAYIIILDFKNLLIYFLSSNIWRFIPNLFRLFKILFSLRNSIKVRDRFSFIHCKIRLSSLESFILIVKIPLNFKSLTLRLSHT